MARSLGVCLSGGGHRATVFALGALLYLVESGRNKDVKAISSVSGGSITNAFLATLSKPFSAYSAPEFEREAARFASQIAGRPGWWWLTILIYLPLFFAWLKLTLLHQPSHLFSIRHLFLLPAVVAWALVAGPRSRGTLWGWWGTWLYLGLLAPSIAWCVVAGVQGWSWWSLVVLLLLAVALFLRGQIADWAFAATITSSTPESGSASRAMSTLPTAVRHVFCATEMHSGRHAYFSHDLVYVPFAGVGDSRHFKLSTAVQTSANFPGGFAVRLIRRRREHTFVGETFSVSPLGRAPRPPWLFAFSDGGVYDNTGASWFLETESRPDGADRWGEDQLKGFAPAMQERARAQLDEMECCPEQLLIVNASEPHPWRTTGWMNLPIVGEAAHLLGVTDIAYNTRGREQALDLNRRFVQAEYRRRQQGAVVSISWTPRLFLHWLTNPGEGKWLRQLFPRTDEVADAVKNAAHKVTDQVRHGSRAAEESREHEAECANLERGVRAAADRLRALSDNRESSAYAQRELELLELQNKLEALKEHFESGRGKAGLSRLDVAEQFSYGLKGWYVPTTLRPLGRDTTATLLWNGYYQTMLNCAVMLEGSQLVEPFPPAYDRFKTLAGGQYTTQTENLSAPQG